VVVRAGPQPVRPQSQTPDVEAREVDTQRVLERDRQVERVEPQTADPSRRHRAPSRQSGGQDLSDMKKQLAGMEAAVREQTERLEDVDRGVTIDPFHLGEELTKYDALNSSS
jgi:hypothetical protein